MKAGFDGTLPFYRRKTFVSSRETLENQASFRENGPVIAGQDWIDGRQAARLL
jgi:hypothetical protein